MKRNNDRRTAQIAVVNRHLGRDKFINYYEANNFISELEDFIDEDVRRMIDNSDYECAFELLNYIFTTIGNVDMDDSDGGTGMLADRIYQFWIELLSKVTTQGKEKMFVWFTNHLDGSIIDYLEEYIEQIIMEEFKESEYRQEKCKRQRKNVVITRQILKNNQYFWRSRKNGN